MTPEKTSQTTADANQHDPVREMRGEMRRYVSTRQKIVTINFAKGREPTVMTNGYGRNMYVHIFRGGSADKMGIIFFDNYENFYSVWKSI